MINVINLAISWIESSNIPIPDIIHHLLLDGFFLQLWNVRWVVLSSYWLFNKQKIHTKFSRLWGSTGLPRYINIPKNISGLFCNECRNIVAVHLGVKMADTLSIGWHPKVSQNWSSKMRSDIVHHKSDRKSCVLPTADRNIWNGGNGASPGVTSLCKQVTDVTKTQVNWWRS